VAPDGDLVICEDTEGDQYVAGATSEGHLYRIAHNARGDGEFAGATFSHDGRILFVNIQDPGITFAILGPWRR
jgi:secreted PhoX family phosphatase